MKREQKTGECNRCGLEKELKPHGDGYDLCEDCFELYDAQIKAAEKRGW